MKNKILSCLVAAVMVVGLSIGVASPVSAAEYVFVAGQFTGESVRTVPTWYLRHVRNGIVTDVLWTDLSSANQVKIQNEIAAREAGTYSQTIVGGIGATNSAGDDVSITSGAGNGTGAGGTASVVGGVSGSGATGNGGPVNITAGAAASTAGTGGAVTVLAGVGTTTGLGGAVLATSGGGGNAAAGGTGAAGGVITLTTGAGGTTVTGTGGASGAASLKSGVGGAASGAGTGGAGGLVALTAGAGGATTTSTGGAGGDVTLTAANGGAASGAGTGGAGGTITLAPGTGGTHVGGAAGKDGMVIIGGTNPRPLALNLLRSTISNGGVPTIAQTQGGVLYQDASGGNVTMTTETAANLALGFPDMAVGNAIVIYVASNHATQTSTIAGGNNVTLVGNGAVIYTGGTFLLIKTAATPTFDLVRVG